MCATERSNQHRQGGTLDDDTILSIWLAIDHLSFRPFLVFFFSSSLISRDSSLDTASIYLVISSEPLAPLRHTRCSDGEARNIGE